MFTFKLAQSKNQLKYESPYTYMFRFIGHVLFFYDDSATVFGSVGKFLSFEETLIYTEIFIERIKIINVVLNGSLHAGLYLYSGDLII